MTTAAFGDEPLTVRTPNLSLTGQPGAAAEEAPPATANRPFGTEGTRWWTVGIGGAYNFDDAVDYNVRLAYSHFLIDDVEFSLELNGWYFTQDGDNAFGVNPAMVFRWHWYNQGPWTAFLDAGVGFLVATDNVPDGGTSFDFTPRAGGGFTREIDADTRLQVGIRWHHISNGRIFGDESNPSRDAVMVYAGIQWRF